MSLPVEAAFFVGESVDASHRRVTVEPVAAFVGDVDAAAVVHRVAGVLAGAVYSFGDCASSVAVLHVVSSAVADAMPAGDLAAADELLAVADAPHLVVQVVLQAARGVPHLAARDGPRRVSQGGQNQAVPDGSRPADPVVHPVLPGDQRPDAQDDRCRAAAGSAGQGDCCRDDRAARHLEVERQDEVAGANSTEVRAILVD
jgi:hypothetical protein